MEGVRWDLYALEHTVSTLYKHHYPAKQNETKKSRDNEVELLTTIPHSPNSTHGITDWPKFSLICGGVAVAITIALMLLPSNKWQAIGGGLVGVFLLVTGVVLSLNPANFYRRLLCYVVPAGVLIEAAGFSFDVWFRGNTDTGFRWHGNASNGFFFAWALIITCFVVADCWTRRKLN